VLKSLKIAPTTFPLSLLALEISSTALSILSCVLPWTMTSIFCSTNLRAVCFPMPSVVPVINASFFLLFDDDDDDDDDDDEADIVAMSAFIFFF
jgi:hypothetical protein